MGESLEMQQHMVEKYVQGQGDMRLQGVYRDNGETGTDFERPGFEEMMDRARKGEIDCIVVKDDCVILELNSESPENTGLCDVSSVF